MKCVTLQLIILFLSLWHWSISPAYAEYPTEDIEFIYMNNGEAPLRGGIDGLEAFLQDNPEVMEAISKNGRIRVIIHEDRENFDHYEVAKNIRHRIRDVLIRNGFEPQGFLRRAAHKILAWPEVVFMRVDLDEARNSAKENAQSFFDAQKGEAFSEEAFDAYVKDLEDSLQATETPSLFRRITTRLTQFTLHTKAMVLLAKEELKRAPLRALGKGTVHTAALPLKLTKQGFSFGGRLLWRVGEEAYFLPLTLFKNFRVPIKDLRPIEMFQGGSAKFIPFMAALSYYALDDVYGNVAWAFWTATFLSFALDTFHGVWASTWLDFQDDIKKKKSFEYQKKFNFYYGLFWGMMGFRMIAYMADVIKPGEYLGGWVGLETGFMNAKYLAFLYITAKIGAHFGSKGYNGINRLYETGAISKQMRDFLQQWVRDFFFCMTGLLISTGGEQNIAKVAAFLSVGFLTDLLLYSRGQRSVQKPALTIGSPEAIYSEDFADRFPNAVRDLKLMELLRQELWAEWSDLDEKVKIERLKAMDRSELVERLERLRKVPSPEHDPKIDAEIVYDVLLAPLTEVGKGIPLVGFPFRKLSNFGPKIFKRIPGIGFPMEKVYGSCRRRFTEQEAPAQ